MSLLRDRTWYFIPAFWAQILTGVLTLGIWPTLTIDARLRRWHRHRWLTLQHYARAFSEETDDDSGRELKRLADDLASDRFRAGMPALIGILGLGAVVQSLAGANWHFSSLLLNGSLQPPAMIATAGSLLLAGLVFARFEVHRRQTVRFTALLKDTLIRSRRRPIVVDAGRWLSPWIAVSILPAFVGAVWLVAPLALTIVWAVYIRHQSAVVNPRLVSLLTELAGEEPDAFHTGATHDELIP